MPTRIEIAEVLSFRLKVPKLELERLPQNLGPELGVVVETEGSELVVSIEEGDSYLRFRTIGAEAVLTEVVLCNDERGLFFNRVAGALMLRFHGDLNARLTWNTAEKNTEGEYAEVKIVRGSTTYPGLSNPFLSLPPAVASEQRAGSNAVVSGMENEQGDAPLLTPEQREVEQLLARAKAHWDEYQRLKAKK